MRTSSMSNPNQGGGLIGQLPPNSALLKSVNAPGGQNAAPKLFNPANAMALNNHRSTPPIPSATFPTFQQLRPQQLPPASNTQQQQQRILAGFPPHGLDTNAITNDSDFPALNKRASPASQNNIFGTFNNLQQSMSMYASPTKEAIGSMQQRMPYANLMRVDGYIGPTTEFSPEDFPALPGATQQQQMQMTAIGSSSSHQARTESQLVSQPFGAQPNSFYNASSADFFSSTNGTNENGKDSKLGISINTSTGMVTNIPAGMICDQYGMVGLLSFMRSIDQFPGLRTLSLGLNVAQLCPNINSPERNLYQTFGGPWAEQPCRIQDSEVQVPPEYLTSGLIREKLPQIKVNKLSEDILFYLFYNCPGQVYQLAASCELYQRDWRYHKIDGVWLTRSLYGAMKEQTPEYEKGSYNIFDPVSWRKIPKEMTLEYKVLEARPTPINPNLNGQPFAGINGTASTPAGQPTSASFIGAQTPTAGNVPSQIPSAQQSSNMAAHFKNI